MLLVRTPLAMVTLALGAGLLMSVHRHRKLVQT
jgi:hypothetical protein